MGFGMKKGGTAASCVELLGGGLTIDQLRWVFSSLSTDGLISTGWDRSSVQNLDGDDDTHLWSELHENCSSTEIVLAGEEVLGGGHEGNVEISDLFYKKVLTARGESPRDLFLSESTTELDEYIHSHEGAIAFFHLYDMLSADFQERDLVAVAIKDDEDGIVWPSAKAFETGRYPILRKIYVGLVNSPQALAVTRPFFEFALSSKGGEILKNNGYWPIRDWEKRNMFTRVKSQWGLDISEIRESCAHNDGRILIGGSDTVLPVAHVWSEAYNLGCPTKVRLEGGGSTSGAGRICGNFREGSAVDVGMMSRHFDKSEARQSSSEDFLYDCVAGDETRSAVQIDVALDGITVMFPVGSIGERCVKLLGGLTMDQLRWIYSSYTDEELEMTGWAPESLKHSDRDPSTHLWSELDARCPNEEIDLAGDYWNDGSFTAFSQLILPYFGEGETISTTRPKQYSEVYGFDALKFMLDHDDAISYVGYHYFYENQEVFWAAPIENELGAFVAPSEESIADGSYPLVRSIFMNLLNDKKSLRASVPLIEFGFSNPGLIEASGYVPILGEHREEMLKRLREAPYGDIDSDDDDERSLPVGVILGIVFGALAFIALLVLGFICLMYSK